METEKNMDFDPDFSEYNPNVRVLSSQNTVQEDVGFIAGLIKKLSLPVVIVTD